MRSQRRGEPLARHRHDGRAGRPVGATTGLCGEPPRTACGPLHVETDALPEAKREPTFRFSAVYDRIYRLDVLEAAWALVAANDGAPGVDGVTITAIKASPDGPATLVATLHEELRAKR